MNPNESFKQKDKQLTVVRDNGIMYYMVRCSECHKERYVSARNWHGGVKTYCPTGCVIQTWKRV